MADTDDLFDGDNASDDGASGNSDEGNPPVPQGDGSDAGTSDSSAEDRIRALQARADKAEAELRRVQGLDSKGQPKPKGDPKPVDAAPDSRESEYAEFLKEAAKERLYNEEPRLKAFGYSLEDIDGDSLSAMKANRDRLAKVIDRAESRALNAAFEKVGLDPALAGGPREKRDFNAMSEEEFEKEIAKAKGLA